MIPTPSLPYPRRSRRGRAPLGAALAAVLALVSAPLAAAAQEPPDSIRADTLRADTLPPALAPDTVPGGDPGSLGARGDSVSADTIFYNLPRLEPPGPSGFAAGVWSWDRDDIQALGVLTLADLLAHAPGVLPLQAGDFGNPVAVTAFGLGGGRIRVLRDGFEVLPLEGGVADLSRIGLAGLGRVRLERGLGEVVVHLEGLEFEDGRPYSMVEAGTGDLNTNLFRGTFANPTALGGSVALALERTDSRGARGNEEGNVTGTWLRYQLHRGDRAGLALDFRRVGSESAAEPYPSPVTRTDWTVRGRAELLPGVRGEAYWGKSTHKVEDVRDLWAAEGGSRSQMGLRIAADGRGLFARGAFRRFGGEGLPSNRFDVSAGADLPAVGGLEAGLSRSAFPDATASARRVRAWTRPLLGLSLFGSWEDGTFGARTFPLQSELPEDDGSGDGTEDEAEPVEPGDPTPPAARLSERTATRVGALWSWGDVALSGARLRIEADSLLPLGFVPDRGQPALGGGVREGWEAWGRLPLPILEGLRLEGTYQQWDEDWSYLPRRSYRGALVFHRTYLESGNLEWWWSLGVRGHDPMSVRQVVGEALDEEGNPLGPELAGVPFYQNWYASLQLRIVTVHLFLGWENFTIRRNLQTVPDRLLPITRAFYGLRWTFWN